MALETQLSEREASIQDLDRRLSDERGRTAQLHRELETQRQEVEQYRTSMETLEKRCASLETSLDDAQAAHRTTSSQLTSAQAQLAESNARCSTLGDECEALRAAVAEFSTQCESLRKDARAAQIARSELSERLSTAEASAEQRTVDGQVAVHEALRRAAAEHAEQMRLARESHAAELAQVRAAAEKERESIAAGLGGRADTLAKAEHEAQLRVAKIESELADTKDEVARLRLKCEHHAAVASSLEDKRVQACTDRDALFERMQAAEQESARLAAKATRATADVLRARKREDASREVAAKQRAELERRIAELTECLDTPSNTTSSSLSLQQVSSVSKEKRVPHSVKQQQNLAAAVERARSEERLRSQRLLSQIMQQCRELEDAATANHEGYENRIQKAEAHCRAAEAKCRALERQLETTKGKKMA